MRKIVLILSIVVMFASFANANLIENGDFESPDIAFGTWTWFVDGVVPGWTVEHTFATGNEYEPRLEMWDHLYGYPPYSGDQHIELDSFDPTTISQEVETETGVRYVLTYAWGPRPGTPDNQLKVWVNDVEIAHRSASGVGNTQIIWTLETYEFQATGTLTTVAFAEIGPDDQLGMLLDAISLTTKEIEVDIDIKPGSYPNSININGSGLITVAILGSETFDVSNINIGSLVFAGLDVAVRGKDKPMCKIEDVSGNFSEGPEGTPDGYPDLVCHFEDDPSLWSPTDGTAEVTGLLNDGTILMGIDEIRLVP